MPDKAPSEMWAPNLSYEDALKQQQQYEKYALKYTDPGTATWMQQMFTGSAPLLSQLQAISAKQGALTLNVPEYNVKQGTKYTKMFQASGRREGDVAAQGISNALAARGGGNLGGALSAQSQGRASTAGQGLAQGVGYDFQQYQTDLSDYMTRLGTEQAKFASQMSALEAQRTGLQNALATRFNILNQIVGAHLGQLSASAQIEVAKTGAEAQETSAFYGLVGSLFGNR